MRRPPNPVGKFCEASGLWINTQMYEADWGQGRAIRILTGFKSDGASIPTRLLRALVGPRYSAKTFAAAWNHDAGYAAELLPRSELDALFRRHLRLIGCNVITANIYWFGVAAGGWAAWRKHTPESIAEARKLVSLVHEPKRPVVCKGCA